MKRIVVGALLFLGGFAVGRFSYYYQSNSVVSPFVGIIEQKRPLEKYSIENLQNRTPQGGPIVFDKAIATTSAYTSYLMHFTSEGKKVTGLVNIPANDPPAGGFPVIVQIRGYVDPEMYTTGTGTKRSGEIYAANGFITIAPDFLGYAGSDALSSNIFEDRFQTYTTVLDLLSVLSTIPHTDTNRVGMWGHSNGGHIALTVLEITKKRYPTTLWAPVTKPFPYSILYYTDEADDGGKFLRKQLASFEALYNVDEYSLTNYIDAVNAPILYHQGAYDEAVPESWSDTFVKSFKDAGKDVTYYIYPGADHNLNSDMGAWSTVVGRDIEFFTEKLGD